MANGDFFTPAWIDAWRLAQEMKGKEVVFVGLDVGIRDESAITVATIGESGWQFLELPTLDPLLNDPVGQLESNPTFDELITRHSKAR